MKRQFAALLEVHTPKVNEVIMNGLATVVVPFAMEYVDNNFRSISKSFPEGLRYIGCERCSPQEEYKEITRDKNNKRLYDLAENSIFLVKYKFEYFGEPLKPKYLYLPFVEDAGLIKLRGSLFHVTPMLTDSVISPDNNKIFVRLLKVKLIFERVNHTYVKDGMNDYVSVSFSSIYKNKAEKGKSSNRVKTTNLHYLFCKYGFTETFKRFLGFVPVVGEDNINLQNYPEKDWVICKSTGLAPDDRISKFYRPNKTRLAIPRAKWNENDVKTMVGSFFYIVDYFPEIKPDWLDSQSKWMYLLGCIIFSPDQGIGRLNERVNEHMISLDNYLDDIVKEKIIELGYNITSFYDLLYIILRDFDNFINISSKNQNSLYKRNFEILYYITFILTKNFVKMNYNLIQKVNKKGNNKPLSLDTVEDIVNKEFKVNAIIRINNQNQCVAGVNYSGDNKYPKLTSICGVQQSSDSSGANRGNKTRNTPNASKHLHASFIEVGSLLALSKSNPSPAYRTNMYVNVSVPDGKIIRNPKYVETLDKLQDDLKRRSTLLSEEFETIDDVDLNVEDSDEGFDE